MGAENFCTRGTGKTAMEAFGNACHQEAYEHGHGGYTGTLAEKHDFIAFPLPELPEDMTPDEFALMTTYTPATYGGKHYWKFVDGKSVEVKVAAKPIPGPLRAIIESIGEAVDDKWGPAGCIELPESADADGNKTFIFFGWASS